MKRILAICIILVATLMTSGSMNAQNLRAINRQAGKPLHSAQQKKQQTTTRQTSAANRTAGNANKRQNNTPHVVKRTTNNSGNIHSESTHYSDGRIVTVTKTQCFACHGKRICQTCFGSGQQYYPYGAATCGMCFGSTKCSACKGEGVTVTTTVTQNGNSTAISPDGPVRHAGGGSTTTGSGRTNNSSSRYGNKNCSLCQGTGTCRSCGGNGHLNGNLNNPSASCPNCLGHTTGQIKDYGLCKRCKGSGQTYGIK